MFTVSVEMGVNNELGVSTMCFDKKVSVDSKRNCLETQDSQDRLLVILILYLVNESVIQ